MVYPVSNSCACADSPILFPAQADQSKVLVPLSMVGPRSGITQRGRPQCIMELTSSEPICDGGGRAVLQYPVDLPCTATLKLKAALNNSFRPIRFPFPSSLPAGRVSAISARRPSRFHNQHSVSTTWATSRIASRSQPLPLPTIEEKPPVIVTSNQNSW